MGKILVDIREENDTIKNYFENKDLVSVEDLLISIDELLYEIEHQKEEFEDYKEEVRENYTYKW